MEASEAFDILLRELRQALKKAQDRGERAFKEGRFDDAKQFAKLGEEISESIEFVESLQRKWPYILQIPEAGPVRKRASRGSTTPVEAFWIPILTALEELGGKGRSRDIIRRVGEIMKEELRDIDMEVLQDGRTVRWQKAAAWARYQLVQEGLLSSDSPRGTWEITDAGRAYLKEHSSG